MTERIKKLTELTLSGSMYPSGKKVEFERSDLFLAKSKMTVKRIHDYVMAQENLITEYQTMARPCILDGTQVESDYMHFGSTEDSRALLNLFYCKPIENLSTFEWQHATPDYTGILKIGISGLIEKINKSKEVHCDDSEKIDFLECLESVANTLIEWACKCSLQVLAAAKQADNSKHKENLTKLSETLKRIPENPPETLYEAILFINILFAYEPDSVGTLDRTLYPYYKSDLGNGIETRESAKEILQEFFLMLQANTPKNSDNFTRGGESHFCVGGYNENKEDVFNDFSMLIIEALTELPTFIPQISLRWTKRLSFETFKKILDIAVNDDNKRIAFINDEVKIHSAMHIAEIPYNIACRYTSVGCNEVAYPGGFFVGSTNSNIMRSLENTMYLRCDEIIKANSWDEFFEIYKSELFKDIDKILYYEDEFMRVRARDNYYATSLLFTDCIESGKSFTKGACKHAVAGCGLIGITNVIDSLAIIKQFVYDEKAIDMKTLVDALKNNWNGYEDLLALIKKKGDFFGNDGETSNTAAKLLTDTIYNYTKDKTSFQGYHMIFGNLQGYWEHHKWFGEDSKATPDGRKNGDPIKFGLGQNGGYDREGLTALLNSVAKCDSHGIISGGPSVTNINIDEQLIKKPGNFPKTAKMLETYFQNGGSQFQLNFVSREDLENAKISPEEYRNLRVRVSGFSDYFVRLDDSLQNEIISRTVKS